MTKKASGFPDGSTVVGYPGDHEGLHARLRMKGVLAQAHYDGLKSGVGLSDDEFEQLARLPEQWEGLDFENLLETINQRLAGDAQRNRKLRPLPTRRDPITLQPQRPQHRLRRAKDRQVLIAWQVFSPVRYMQMVGRGLRGEKNGGTANCRIVTVLDNLGRFFEKHPYHFCATYFLDTSSPA